MGWFDPVGWVEEGVDYTKEKASEAWDGVKETASDAWDETKQTVSDGLDTLGQTFSAAPKTVIDLGSEAIDGLGHAVLHPADTARAVTGFLGNRVDDAGAFLHDHGGEILSGLGTVGNIAMTVSGAGPIGGALYAFGSAAVSGIANGESPGDVLRDGFAGAADKFVPGSGHATQVVVQGVQNGESAQEILQKAGLDGMSASDAPALGVAAKLTDDLAHDRSPGRIALDLGSQYVNSATGAGTGHGNPLGEAGVIAVNDIADGKSVGDVGLDIAKAYLHEAAGGDASPTAKLIDTFFDGVERGESPSDILDDMLHKGVDMLNRAQAGDPGAVDKAFGGVPGGSYAEKFVDDLAHGKSLEQSFEDAGRQAASDAFDQSGAGDVFKGAGLDPFRPYVETAEDDFAHGKSFEQIAQHVGSQVLGDAFKQSGFDNAVGHADSFAQGALGDLVHAKADQIGHLVSHTGFHPDWVEVNPQPLPPMPDPEGGNSSFWTKVSDVVDQVVSHTQFHPDWAELNPQPLPPGPDPEGADASGLAKVIDAAGQAIAGVHPDWVELNPQPLPPGPDPEGADASSLAKVIDAAGQAIAGVHPVWVGLNPQPLPPGPDPEGADASSLAKVIDAAGQAIAGVHPDWVALNPQPLPPGPDPEKGIHLSDAGSAVSLNPQPLPPGPDPETGFHLSDAVLTHGPDPAVHAILGALNPAPVSDFQDYGVMATHYEPPLH